jgi:hypothetical protein
MLPLRSRTSWRLRALTVTCLPRDWTRAGVYHFANNRRRGHDLPEGHHGELVEQVRATRHTRQSLGLADPRALQVRQDPGTRQALSRRWTSSRGSLRRRHGHHQISYGSNGAASITRASATPTTISSKSASLTRPRAIPWPPRASPARPARRTFRPSRSLSLPHGQFVKQACAAADAVRPTLGREGRSRIATPNERPV